jgi:hypothetical protein
MKIVVHDAFSSLRMRLERKTEPAIMLIRGVINEAMMPGRLTIWCWDGKGGNDRRRAIYPGYKNRPPTPNATHQSLMVLKELLSFTPAFQVQMDGFEGDDAVAAVVEHFAGQAPIEIITRDGDLSALCRPGVTCTAEVKDVPPHLVPLYKLTVGDKSDTIPGLKAFGPLSWQSADKAALQRFVDGGSDKPEGMSEATFRWAVANRDQIEAMRQIIAPMPFPLNEALTQGVDNPAAREALMSRFLL